MVDTTRVHGLNGTCPGVGHVKPKQTKQTQSVRGKGNTGQQLTSRFRKVTNMSHLSLSDGGAILGQA